MKKEEFTKENKMRWLSRMFFSVADSPNHDVNPYDDVPSFLNAKAGSLNWGSDKKSSKERFCNKFFDILELYEIHLSKENILKALEKENISNKDIVDGWSDIAKFPKD
jgi:hypothetical protein